MGITQAILKLRIEYANLHNESPYQINCGSCDMFAANIARQGFGEGLWGCEIPIEDWSLVVQDAIETDCFDDFGYFADCHCFIRYRGKYYDSECPQGCEYPDHLPIFQRNLEHYELC